MNIRNKNILRERSVRFKEPLQYLELMEEETIEIPSPFAEVSRDENESVISDISNMMSDISENDILGSELDPNVPTHLPKWAEKTLSSAGIDAENLACHMPQFCKNIIILFDFI